MISVLPPAFGGSCGIPSILWRFQPPIFLSAQLFSSQLFLCLREEIFSYPTWGSRNPSWVGKTSFCFSPTSPNFLPLSSHTLLSIFFPVLVHNSNEIFQLKLPLLYLVHSLWTSVRSVIFYSRLSIGGLKLKGRKSVKYILCHYPKLKKLYFFITRKCWLETLEKSPVVFID